MHFGAIHGDSFGFVHDCFETKFSCENEHEIDEKPLGNTSTSHLPNEATEKKTVYMHVMVLILQ